MLLQIQLYGLIFLLGSFTVASLSDLRRMAAQRDFAEVWGLFTLVMFVHDIYFLSDVPQLLSTKWILIVAFVIVTLGFKVLFSISLMDITAVCAVLSILDPIHIVLYLILLLVVKELTSPLLHRFGEGGAYPFLPVVLITTVLMAAVIWSGGIEELIQLPDVTFL